MFVSEEDFNNALREMHSDLKAAAKDLGGDIKITWDKIKSYEVTLENVSTTMVNFQKQNAELSNRITQLERIVNGK